MAFTYDDSDFADTAAGRRNEVRFLISDTVSADAQFTDNEIAQLLSDAGNVVLNAAISGLETLIARWARRSNIRMGELSVGQSSVVESLSKALDRLKARRNTGVVAFCGGRTISGKDDLREDTDAVQPRFERGGNSIDGLSLANNPATDDD